jgi:hypothetical protein
MAMARRVIVAAGTLECQFVVSRKNESQKRRQIDAADKQNARNTPPNERQHEICLSTCQLLKRVIKGRVVIAPYWA